MKKVVLFKGASEEYQKAFSDINYEAIFVEPLQFIFMNLEELSEKLNRTDYEGLILTSPRAIEAVAKCWDPSKFVTWNTKKIYTVGEMSGLKVKQMLGLEAIGTTAGNAENLSKIIIKDNVEQSKFLFPCGTFVTETLPKMLQEARMEVEAITVYDTRENVNLKAELMELNNLADCPCGMVFFSPSGCEYIHRQLQTFNNKLSTLPHFAIGNSTAHKIEILGLEIAGVAAKPKPDSLRESVQTYFTGAERCS